jgi:hypothetical protein
VTEDPEPFAYSTQEWGAVLATIPAAKAADADLMLTVRRRLEEAASDYHALTFHHRRRFPKGKPSPTVAWKRRRRLIARALAGVEPTLPGAASYVEHLREAHRLAEAQVVAYEMRGRGHKGTVNPERDMFYEKVLGVWARDLDGALTTASRTTGSAAIRFFALAVGPVVDRPIKREAIAKIIIAERRRRRTVVISNTKKN